MVFSAKPPPPFTVGPRVSVSTSLTSNNNTQLQSISRNPLPSLNSHLRHLPYLRRVFLIYMEELFHEAYFRGWFLDLNYTQCVDLFVGLGLGFMHGRCRGFKAGRLPVLLVGIRGEGGEGFEVTEPHPRPVRALRAKNGSVDGKGVR